MERSTFYTLSENSADGSTSLKKIKILPHDAQRVFYARMMDLEMTILDYELGEVVVRCYDDGVTSTSSAC